MILLLCLVSLLCLLTGCLGQSRPNIVLFLVDDLGHGDLGYSGHPTTSSTNIDWMARNGQILTQFYSGSPVCTPSRATLLTGRYSPRSGMYPDVLFPNNIGGLPPTEVTIPELLKERGYRTALAGKWHLGVGQGGKHLPLNHGFDQYFGIPYSQDMCPFLDCYEGEPCDLPSPWPQRTNCPLYQDHHIIEQPVNFPSITPRLAGWAKQFVMDKVEKDVPFFLMYAFHHVHFPQFSSPMFRNTSLRGSFGDSVTEVDWAVGDLLTTLLEQGVLDDTLVIFSSDNGPRLRQQGANQAGDAGLFKCGKATTWEGGQRVPAILHWPAKIAPRVNPSLSSFLDILPTLISFLDGNTSALDDIRLDGYDLTGSIFNKDPSPREEFLYISHNRDKNDTGIDALRHKNFKAHFRTQGNINSISENDPDCGPGLATDHNPPLLYNLEADPAERFELSADPEYAEVLAEMISMKDMFEKQLDWADSQMEGTDTGVEPCCSPGCQPFPSCCTCT